MSLEISEWTEPIFGSAAFVVNAMDDLVAESFSWITFPQIFG
jgi:hypothetical protein